VAKKNDRLAEAGDSDLVGTARLQWGEFGGGGRGEKIFGEWENGNMAITGWMGATFQK
jgi:hypothetical protein